jgi:hypothetical protein
MAVEDGSAGCEFVDDGGYGKQHPPKRAVSFTNQFHLPTEIVLQLSNPIRMNEVNKELDYIHELEISISNYGIKEPLEIHSDPSGCMYLKDGHHRLAACILLGKKSIPVFGVMDAANTTRGYRVMMLPAGISMEKWFDLVSRK